ncbi:MAG: universal stress protein [Dehalococcoidia bacterium]|jgi:nucleotide-binding universal stress UspA family protein|nr:universal stress protein [Dehalococcoidia bacterium]
MFQKILFPTDGSQDAEAALAYLAPLAANTGAEVVVLEVVERATSNNHMPVIDSILTSEKDPWVISSEQTEASDHLKDVVAQLRGTGIEHVVPTVKVGHVAEAILEAVDDLSCDTIVMATHGRSAIKRFFLGSTAERVLKDAPCPVLLVPARAGIPLAESATPEVASV